MVCIWSPSLQKCLQLQHFPSGSRFPSWPPGSGSESGLVAHLVRWPAGSPNTTLTCLALPTLVSISPKQKQNIKAWRSRSTFPDLTTVMTAIPHILADVYNELSTLAALYLLYNHANNPPRWALLCLPTDKEAEVQRCQQAGKRQCEDSETCTQITITHPARGSCLKKIGLGGISGLQSWLHVRSTWQLVKIVMPKPSSSQQGCGEGGTILPPLCGAFVDVCRQVWLL